MRTPTRIDHADADSPSVERMSRTDLHGIAEVITLPCSVSVLKGRSSLEHLNRSLTVDTTAVLDKGRLDGFLCNANGRILDRLMMCMLDEEMVLVGNIAAGEATREILIRGVAWDEEITVMDGDGAIAHLRLVGDAPNRCIAGLGIDPDEVVGDRWTEYGTVLLSRVGVHGVDAIDLLVPTSDCAGFIALLEENGAVVPDAGRSELVRIELGMLDHREMNEGFLPMDLGLEKLVDLAKGCYPGQEVHARLDSRGNPTRCIARLRLASEIEVGRIKLPGGGSLVVTASTSTLQGTVALAVVPLRLIEDGTVDLGGGLVAEVQSL